MRMKKRFMLVNLAVAVCMLLSVASPAIVLAEQIKLRYATFVPPNTDMGQWHTWWIKEVEKRTNGRVKIEAHFSQSFCSLRETLAMVSKGAVELGGLGYGLWPKRWPLMAGLTDIHFFLGRREAMWVFPKLYQEVPALEKEVNVDNNVMALDYGYLGHYGLISRKPVHSLADLKGLRVRTWGELFPKKWTPYGAVPTTVLAPETYEAMQKGLFDASPISFPSCIALGMQEVAKYFLMDAPILCVPGNWTGINLDTWKKLPSDIKKTLLELKKDSIKANIELSDRLDTEGRKKMLDAGVQFTRLPEKEAQEWLKLVNSITEKYLTEGIAGKAEDGKVLWNAMQRLRRAYFQWIETPEGKQWMEPTPGTEIVFDYGWAKSLVLGN